VLDTVIHGHNGLLCDPEDEDDLVARVTELVRSPQTMADFGVSARQFALKLNWADVFKQLVNDYRDVTSRPRRRNLRPRWLPLFENFTD
jgi:glycosyltransferase involved in cell wall biosynthesis